MSPAQHHASAWIAAECAGVAGARTLLLPSGCGGAQRARRTHVPCQPTRAAGRARTRLRVTVGRQLRPARERRWRARYAARERPPRAGSEPFPAGRARLTCVTPKRRRVTKPPRCPPDAPLRTTSSTSITSLTDGADGASARSSSGDAAAPDASPAAPADAPAPPAAASPDLPLRAVRGDAGAPTPLQPLLGVPCDAERRERRASTLVGAAARGAPVRPSPSAAAGSQRLRPRPPGGPSGREEPRIWVSWVVGYNRCTETTWRHTLPTPPGCSQTATGAYPTYPDPTRTAPQSMRNG